MIQIPFIEQKHTQDIDRIVNQRRKWLISNSVVHACVILLIIGWDWIAGFHQNSSWWIIVSLIIMVLVNWWCWTMQIIQQSIKQQSSDCTILSGLLDDIQDLKKQLAELSIDNCEQ